MIDFVELTLETIQSQYGASPHLRGVIEAIAKRLDPNVDIDLFYEKIFNLDTAEGMGLDIWGEIVGVSRTLWLEGEGAYFGFDGSQLNPFNQAPFFYDATEDRVGYKLDDTAYRKLIYYRALANISDSSAPTQSRLLSELFEGKVQVFPVGKMKIRVVFHFYMDEYILAIFNAYGLLNRGAGVDWEYYQIASDETFGFKGSDLQPFNQGIFAPYHITQS